MGLSGDDLVPLQTLQSLNMKKTLSMTSKHEMTIISKSTVMADSKNYFRCILAFYALFTSMLIFTDFMNLSITTN